MAKLRKYALFDYFLYLLNYWLGILERIEKCIGKLSSCGTNTMGFSGSFFCTQYQLWVAATKVQSVNA